MRPLEDSLEQLLGPPLAELGLELIDLELKRRGAKLWVRVFLDRVDRADGGIGVDECGKANRELSQLLDVAELIPESYLLEVSSPGVNRRLGKREHFEAVVGEKVKVVTKEKISGSRKFIGTLSAVRDDGIEIESDDGPALIPLAAIDRANLEYDFNRDR